MQVNNEQHLHQASPGPSSAPANVAAPSNQASTPTAQQPQQHVDPAFQQDVYLQQQQQMYHPSTPTASSQQPLAQAQQLSPAQPPPNPQEHYAQLPLSALITSGQTFNSPDSTASVSPVYPPPSATADGATALLGGIAQSGASSTFATGGPIPPPTSGAPSLSLGSIPRALGMELDPSFPTPPHSAPSTAVSTPSSGGPPQSRAAPTYAYYPAASSVAAPTPAPQHPSVQRHHPYAHPSHGPTRTVQQPPPLAHSQSSSAVPLFFTNNTAPPTPVPATTDTNLPSPASQLAPPTPSAQSPHPLAFSPAPPAPHRNHSAPAHFLTLSTNSSEGSHPHPLSNSSEMETGEYGNPGAGDQPMEDGAYHGVAAVAPVTQVTQEWLQQQQMAQAQAQAQNGVRDWDGDRSMSAPNEGAKEGAPGYFDGNGSFVYGPPAQVPPPQAYAQPNQPLPTQSQPPPQQSAPSPAPLPPPPPAPTPLLDSPVAAIALVRNRLPILEAALNHSATEPGLDEEEIWKGVEGAYEELKRVMLSRKEVRRATALAAGTVAGGKRPYSSMELESPTTPVDSSRSHAAAKFLNNHPPPLIHSQSSPVVPLSAQANVARAVAQVQASQVQLQMAQLQVQAEVEARNRAEAEQRAREEEQQQQQQRAKIEAEQREAEEAKQREQHFQQAAAHHHQQQQLALQEEHMRAMQAQAAAAQAQANANAIAQAQAQANAVQAAQVAQAAQLAQYSSAYYPTSAAPTPPSHAPPPLSLSTLSPTQQQHLISTNSPVSRVTPQYSATGSAGLAAAFEPIEAVQVPGDMSMGAVMQMHLGGMSQPYPAGGTVDPMEISSGATTAAHDSFDGARKRGNSVYAALTAAASGISSASTPTPGRQELVASPPSTTLPSLASRPSRSRAASGSGYMSASGSRSRAASGSGYQSLLESRSRAASSASSVFGTYEREEEDELDDQDDHEDAPTKASTAAPAGVDPALRAALDPIFLEFLADLCSNLEATDSKGEPIHQTLMAKKMERLDQSQDFRPFKFRIQAFTSAFGEKLTACGFTEADLPFKKIRQYLWAQPCISRFNDDGKKAKSKGNHIWSIEAKKVPEKKWVFREFVRCIKGTAPSVAFCGLPWSWAPRVWDPQCSVAAIGATFSSPSLPDWLSWEDNVLSGEAPESMKGQTIEIQAIASFLNNGKTQHLEASCSVLVASVGEHEAEERMKADIKPDLSAENSQVASPQLGATATFPDPSASTTTLLPSLMDSDQTMKVEAPAAPVDPQADELAIQRYLHEQAQAQAQATQQQQNLDPAMFHAQQESQAALHQRYVNLSALNPPYVGSPASLSYPPAVDLVTSALQRAAFDQEQKNLNGGYSSMEGISQTHSEIGTPNLSNIALSDVDLANGRLAQFALSSQYHPPPSL
ncbi:hypothetical protein MNV49_003138 [Pseudohyphozyma bogoriensis]|nr:hypothetical protein MNV49_003138 [Pseudohyphozyma bogoriensis]